MRGWIWRIVRALNKNSLLIAAIKAGDTKEVADLLKSGADPNSSEGPHSDRLSILDTGNHRTALMVAANERQPEMVKLLLAEGARVNDRDQQGETALYWAILAGNTESCRLLLDSVADIEDVYRKGASPLLEAARRGYPGIVDLLLEKDANLDPSDGLMCARDAPTAALLLKRGANPNARGKLNCTPLMGAADSGTARPELVALLIQHQADVNAVAENGETALTAAEARGHTEIVEMLKKAGATR